MAVRLVVVKDSSMADLMADLMAPQEAALSGDRKDLQSVALMDTKMVEWKVMRRVA